MPKFLGVFSKSGLSALAGAFLVYGAEAALGLAETAALGYADGC